MSVSGQPAIKDEMSFSDIKPIKLFEYLSQVSKIIWDVNSNNILQSSSQIIDLIKTNKISVQTALRIIDTFSTMLVKKIGLFAELYKNITDQFSYNMKPNSLLYRLLDREVKSWETEQILNVYPKESPLYYIAWDKVDDLKSKFPNLDVNMESRHELTPLDCAIRFGSELCFVYLKNKGAKYTKYSEKYAVQGGNQNIFMQMIEDGKSFDHMISSRNASLNI